MSDRKAPALWDREIVSRASVDSCVKLDPRLMVKNPVMFVVEVTASGHVHAVPRPAGA